QTVYAERAKLLVLLLQAFFTSVFFQYRPYCDLMNTVYNYRHMNRGKAYGTPYRPTAADI
ncbi:MAG: hypothetical protein ACPG88_04955, partial [Porticoccaceae bacterium]